MKTKLRRLNIERNLIERHITHINTNFSGKPLLTEPPNYSNLWDYFLSTISSNLYYSGCYRLVQFLVQFQRVSIKIEQIWYAKNESKVGTI